MRIERIEGAVLIRFLTAQRIVSFKVSEGVAREMARQLVGRSSPLKLEKRTAQGPVGQVFSAVERLYTLHSSTLDCRPILTSRPARALAAYDGR